jgi:hypothetical protein
MQRRNFTVFGALGLISFGTLPKLVWAFDLSEVDAASGVRTALEKGVGSAIGLLGKNNGFLDNPKVRIPLPGFLNQAANLLRSTGQKKKVEELELAMNHAAEAAVPEARALLMSTVKNLSIQDATQLVKSQGDNGVTQFFADKTRAPLGLKFLPIVTRATEKVSLADKYNQVAGKAAGLGLLKGKDANIQQYVTEKALDGLYAMIGEEEKKIRQDPVGSGSAILKKVFGKS